MTQPDDKIEQLSKQALDQSVSTLDKSTRTKLAAARQNALEATNNASWLSHFSQPWALAMATLFGMAILIGKDYIVKDPLNNQLATATNTESKASQIGTDNLNTLDELILLSELDDESMGLIEELDFALWLSDEMDSIIDEQDVETSAYRIPTHVEPEQQTYFTPNKATDSSASIMGDAYA